MVLWWGATHVKAERKGQGSRMPEIERAYWLNRKADLRSDGMEGMEVISV